MVNIALTIITPEGRVRKAKSNWMLGGVIMRNHMGVDISGAEDVLAVKANPIFRLVRALPACKLRKMLIIDFSQKFDELFNFRGSQMGAIKFGLHCKALLLICHFVLL